MSKITFRADDDLVERLESCDASKSEVMRRALRAYLEADDDPADGSVDAAVADRVDDLIAERLDEALNERLGAVHTPSGPAQTPSEPSEVNVNVTLDVPHASESDARVTRETGNEMRETGNEVRETSNETRETSNGGKPKTRKTPGSSGLQTNENACSGCGESVPVNHVYCPNCGEKQSHRAFCECGDEIRTDWAFCPGCGRRTPAADVLNDG